MSETTELLRARFGEVIEEAGLIKDKPFVRVRRDALAHICQAAKEMGFRYLACITGVDYLKDNYFEAVYNLYSHTKREHLVIKTRVARNDPTVPSVTGVWKAALFLERETYDLIGIRFTGHPNLKRILLPEPWVGHPLRKDYDMTQEQFVSKGSQGEDIVSFDPQTGW